MMLFPLVRRVGELNMERVKGVEKMGKVREEKRIERVRGMKEVIGEIR